MSLIGYARVSTSEGKQLLDRQVDALKEIGCERIFEDKASGSNSQRKGLDDCLNYLRKGDVLVVLDLDRLGRLASDLIKLIDELAEKDIGFKGVSTENGPYCTLRNFVEYFAILHPKDKPNS